jgi:hypothetical protein
MLNQQLIVQVLTVLGALGESGVHAPRLVEGETRQGKESAMTLLHLMEEMGVRGRKGRPKSAIKTNVQSWWKYHLNVEWPMLAPTGL